MEQLAKYLTLALLVLGVVLKILVIGEPRKPITPNEAVAQLILNGLVVAAILKFWN